MAREQLPPPRRIPTAEAHIVVERLDSEGHLDLRSWPRNESITEIYFGDPGAPLRSKPEDDSPWSAVRTLTLAPGMVAVRLRGFRNLDAIRSPDGRPVDLRIVDLSRCTRLRSLPEFTRSLALFDADGSVLLTSLAIPPGGNLRFLGLRACMSLGSDRIHTLLRDLPRLHMLTLNDTGVEGTLNLAGLPRLQRLEAKGCRRLSRIEGWPATLMSVDCEQCTGLRELSRFPPPAASNRYGVSRLVLSGCSGLADLGFLKTAQELRELHLKDVRGELRLWEAIRALPVLTFLHMGGSRFSDIPDVFCDPFERKLDALRSHFAALEQQGTEEVNACKVLLVGNGAAGKTSLCDVLAGRGVDPKPPATHGIRMEALSLHLKLPDADGGSTARPCSLRIWDFGGQDLYHGTHRIFMRTQAVFLIVWAPNDEESVLARRQGDTCHPLHYWIDQVFSLRSDAEVVLVRNKADVQAPAGSPDRAGDPEYETRLWQRAIPDWQARYSAEQVRRIRAVGLSCHEGRRADPTVRVEAPTEAEKLQHAADRIRLLANLEASVASLLGAPGRRRVPALRAKLFRTLEDAPSTQAGARTPSRSGAWTRSEFLEWARQVTRSPAANADLEDPDHLLHWLHGTGTVFWLRHYGEERIVHDQLWVLDGIYAVFQWQASNGVPPEAALRRSGGWFRSEDLDRLVWSNPSNISGRTYGPAEQRLLLEFMQQCGVAVEGRRSYESPSLEPLYFIPQYAPESPSPIATVLLAKPTLEIAHPSMGRDVFLAFVAHAVSHFGRSASPWLVPARSPDGIAGHAPSRGGIAFEFQKRGLNAAVSWQGTDDLGYGGAMAMAASGPGSGTFLAEIVDALHSLPSWPDGCRLPAAGEAGSGKADLASPAGNAFRRGQPAPHTPEDLVRRAHDHIPTVAISYAGRVDRTDTPFPTSPLEQEYSEKLPRKLYGTLHAKQLETDSAWNSWLQGGSRGRAPVRFHVADYGASDFHLDPDAREGRLSPVEVSRSVAESEFVVLMLSKAFWLSEYCLWELILVYQRFPYESFADDSYLRIDLARQTGTLAGKTALVEHWSRNLVALKELIPPGHSNRGHAPAGWPEQQRGLWEFFTRRTGEPDATRLVDLLTALGPERRQLTGTGDAGAHRLDPSDIDAEARHQAEAIVEKILDPSLALIRAAEAWIERTRALEAEAAARQQQFNPIGGSNAVETAERHASNARKLADRAWFWLARYQCQNPASGQSPAAGLGISDSLLNRLNLAPAGFRELERAYLEARSQSRSPETE